MPGDSCAKSHPGTPQLACSGLIEKDLSPLGQDEFLMGPMKGSSGIGFSISLHEPQSMEGRWKLPSPWFPFGVAWGQIKSNWIHTHSSSLGVSDQFPPKHIMRIRISLIAETYIVVDLSTTIAARKEAINKTQHIYEYRNLQYRFSKWEMVY